MATRTAAYQADRRLLVRGSLWNSIAWAVVFVTGPPITIVLVRSMSHTAYGELAVAGAVIGPVAAVAALGLGPAVSQLGSAEAVVVGPAGLDHVIRTALQVAVRALPWLLVCGAAVVAGMSAAESVHGARWVVAVMLPAVLVAPFGSAFDGYLRATGSVKWLAIAGVAGALCSAAAIVVLVLAEAASPVAVGAARAAAPVVGCIVLAVAVARRRVSSRVAIGDAYQADLGVKRTRVLAFGSAMLVTGLSWLLISQLDVLFLGIDRGSAQAGVYAPASRLADLAISLAALVGALLLPALTTAFRSGDRDKAVHLYHWASRWALVVSAPLIALLLVVPGPVLQLMFGTGFSPTIPAARVLAVGVLVHVVLGFNGFTLEAQGHPRLAAIRSGAGVVISVVLCPLLIPRYGFTGAAVATTAAIVAINVFSSAALLQRFRIGPWDVEFLLAIVGFAVGSAVAWIVQSELHGTLTKCIAVAVISTAAALLLPLTAPGPPRLRLHAGTRDVTTGRPA